MNELLDATMLKQKYHNHDPEFHHHHLQELDQFDHESAIEDNHDTPDESPATGKMPILTSPPPPKKQGLFGFGNMQGKSNSGAGSLRPKMKKKLSRRPRPNSKNNSGGLLPSVEEDGLFCLTSPQQQQVQTSLDNKSVVYCEKFVNKG